MDTNNQDVVLRPGGGGARRCRVLFSYMPQNEDELDLEVDDVIDFISEVEEGWWRGKLRNKVGVFPSNFVSEVFAGGAGSGGESGASENDTSAPLSSPDSAAGSLDDAPILPPKPVKETCVVMFPYMASNEDELNLKKGDVITIITKDVEDKGWWKGEIRGKIGLFPDNFVEVSSPVEELVQHKPERPAKGPMESKRFNEINKTFQKKDENIFNKKDNKEIDKKSVNSIISQVKKLDMRKTSIQDEPVCPSPKTDKNSDLLQIKPDIVSSHRKSLEMKATEGQTPVVPSKKPTPPPVSNKPSLKPSLAKLISKDTPEQRLNDLVDGNVGSRVSSKKRASTGSTGSGNEDVDLDSVERSDMLTHITSSRPKAPGRRPPTKENKENELGHNQLTNGSVDTNSNEKKEKEKEKEREWEKHRPPWVDELKLNQILKSNKSPPPPVTTAPAAGDRKPLSPSKSKSELSLLSSLSSTSATTTAAATTITSLTTASTTTTSATTAATTTTTSVAGRQLTHTTVRPQSMFVDSQIKFNSSSTEDVANSVSRKDYNELKAKVEKLEKLTNDLQTQLREESEKRRIMDKELVKLAELVTRV